MNFLFESGLKGSLLAVLILVSSIFGGQIFGPANTTCDNTLDFQSWMASDQIILPNAFTVTLELGQAQHGYLNRSDFSAIYGNILTKDIHHISLIRTGISSWYQQLWSFDNVTARGDAFSAVPDVISNSTVSQVVALQVVYMVRRQLQLFFQGTLHQWNWDEVIDSGHTDDAFPQITLSLLGSDGSAIAIMFQPHGVMISGVWAMYQYQNGTKLSRDQVRTYGHSLGTSYSWEVSSCRVYYADHDTFTDNYANPIFDGLRQYVNGVV